MEMKAPASDDVPSPKRRRLGPAASGTRVLSFGSPDPPPAFRRTNSLPVVPRPGAYSFLFPLPDPIAASAPGRGPSPLGKRRMSIRSDGLLDSPDMANTDPIAKAANRSSLAEVPKVSLAEWAVLKGSFAQIADLNDESNAHSALSSLHAVLSVCSRFWVTSSDPLALLLPSGERHKVSYRLPPSLSRRQSYHRSHEFELSQPFDSLRPSSPAPAESVDHESPAAFHNLFGRALYLYGRALSTPPAEYRPPPSVDVETCFCAALEVFATGELLCARYLSSPSSTADWSSAFARGRIYVQLALRHSTVPYIPSTFAISPVVTAFLPEASSRPSSIPVAPLSAPLPSTPSTLASLAIDHLSTALLSIPCCSPTRTRALWDAGTDGLAIAELAVPDRETPDVAQVRVRRARWADAMFALVERDLDEPSIEAGSRDPTLRDVLSARGHCHLLVGRTLLAAQRGVAMDALKQAITFFERAEEGQGHEETRRLVASLSISDTEDDRMM